MIKKITNFKLQITNSRGFTLMNLRSVRSERGFTLIELLVVISIIGILVGLSVFGLQGARSSSRDAKRVADLEQVRSGIEIYKTDCNFYPATAQLNLSAASILKGDGSTSSCLVTNTYIGATPLDPISPTSNYAYSSTGASTYTLCASLEKAPSPSMDVSGCGSCVKACNYKVTNP
jgi:prepilin-type N-terminal cleavage/methylation domain-containing protein